MHDVQPRYASLTWKVAQQFDERQGESPGLLHLALHPSHFRSGDHFHGFGDFFDVLHGFHALFDWVAVLAVSLPSPPHILSRTDWTVNPRSRSTHLLGSRRASRRRVPPTYVFRRVPPDHPATSTRAFVRRRGASRQPLHPLVHVIRRQSPAPRGSRTATYPLEAWQAATAAILDARTAHMAPFRKRARAQKRVGRGRASEMECRSKQTHEVNSMLKYNRRNRSERQENIRSDPQLSPAGWGERRRWFLPVCARVCAAVDSMATRAKAMEAIDVGAGGRSCLKEWVGGPPTNWMTCGRDISRVGSERSHAQMFV